MQQGNSVRSSAALVTAEEFARIPDDGCRHELVEGRVVSMSLPGGRHGVVGTRLAALILQFVDAHDLGLVVTNGGFKMAADPDTVRGPDLAFVSAARVPEAGVPDGFWPGAPDLAVEVRSPNDSPSEIREKVRDYLARGVRLVWIVDPRRETVVAYRPDAPPALRSAADSLDGGDLLPGFSCVVRSIFDSGRPSAVRV